MTKTAKSSGWHETEFGTAELLSGYTGWEGRFYSHSYDSEGHADVVAAATDFFEREAEDDATRRIALKLMEQEGVDTDLFQRQSNERWYLNATDILQRARQIRSVL